MTTATAAATKAASVIKLSNGSEKKWSEVLTSNRRHAIQLPIDLKKYEKDAQRTQNSHRRHRNQIESNWSKKHETWYHEDFIFRERLRQQLKPITRRFRRVGTQPTIGEINDNKVTDIRKQNDNTNRGKFILPGNRNENEIYSWLNNETTRKTQFFETSSSLPLQLTKLKCTKIIGKREPRLYSHIHGPFLDCVERFLKRQPQNIEKGIKAEDMTEYKNKIKIAIDDARDRTTLATKKFQESLVQDESEDSDYDDGY